MKPMTISYTTSNNQSFTILVHKDMLSITRSSGEYVGYVFYGDGGAPAGMSDALQHFNNIDPVSRDEVVKFCDRAWKNQAFL